MLNEERPDENVITYIAHRHLQRRTHWDTVFSTKRELYLASWALRCKLCFNPAARVEQGECSLRYT